MQYDDAAYRQAIRRNAGWNFWVNVGDLSFVNDYLFLQFLSQGREPRPLQSSESVIWGRAGCAGHDRRRRDARGRRNLRRRDPVVELRGLLCRIGESPIGARRTAAHVGTSVEVDYQAARTDQIETSSGTQGE